MSTFLQGKPVGTPDPGVYFRILKEHDVAGMFVAPTAIRAIRREVKLHTWTVLTKYHACTVYWLSTTPVLFTDWSTPPVLFTD